MGINIDALNIYADNTRRKRELRANFITCVHDKRDYIEMKQKENKISKDNSPKLTVYSHLDFQLYMLSLYSSLSRSTVRSCLVHSCLFNCCMELKAVFMKI